MRLSQAKELFRSLTEEYFFGANVTLSRLSRIPKPDLPLVSITTGAVNRPLAPAYKEINGVLIGHYLTRLSIDVDLFTHGTPVIDEETGKTVSYENTAVEDMLAFIDFLNSEHTIEWCHKNDVSIRTEGDVQDITGLVNDNNYEYRAKVTVMFYFTQTTVGHASVAQEGSVLYPTGEIDPDSGAPIYTHEQPPETESVSGVYTDVRPDTESIVVPEHKQSSSGGGTEKLAADETGYFTEVDIKEDKSQ